MLSISTPHTLVTDSQYPTHTSLGYMLYQYDVFGNNGNMIDTEPYIAAYMYMSINTHIVYNALDLLSHS